MLHDPRRLDHQCAVISTVCSARHMPRAFRKVTTSQLCHCFAQCPTLLPPSLCAPLLFLFILHLSCTRCHAPLPSLSLRLRPLTPTGVPHCAQPPSLPDGQVPHSLPLLRSSRAPTTPTTSPPPMVRYTPAPSPPLRSSPAPPTPRALVHRARDVPTGPVPLRLRRVLPGQLGVRRRARLLRRQRRDGQMQ